MKPEMKLVVFLFALALLFAVAANTNKKELKSKTTVTPFSKTLDVLSIFSTNRNTQKPNYTVYGYLPYWSIAEYKNLQYDKLTDIAYFGLYLKKDGSFRKYAKVAVEDNEDQDIIDEEGEVNLNLDQTENTEDTETVEETEDTGTLDPGYNNWINNDDLKRIIQKAKKENVRFALTVISHEDEVSDAFLDCPGCWKTMLQNLARELDSKEITDVNLNFEYAAETDPDKAVKYLELTKYLNTELDKVYGDSKLIVTAFADSVVNPRVSSEIAGLGRYSDGIFVMAYDFHTTRSEAAGPVAPIDGGSFNSYDIRTLLRDYLTQVPPNKLILGVPYYGYNWVVESDEPYAIRLPGNDEIGHSKSQPYARIMDLLKGNIETEESLVDPEKDKSDSDEDNRKDDNKDSDKEKGNEEIKEVKFEKPEVKWDEIAACPYFTYENPYTGAIRQVYYDDEKSLKIKYDMVKENKLQGIGIWALGYDGIYNELWNQIYESFIKSE